MVENCALDYYCKWRRHKDTSKMLLTVSSFGESFRRVILGGSIFNGVFTFSTNKSIETYFLGAVSGSDRMGNTMKNVLPFPTVDSTQMRP